MMKQASYSSTDHGGGKRRGWSARAEMPLSFFGIVVTVMARRRSVRRGKWRSGVNGSTLGRRAIKRLVADRRQEKAPRDGGQRGFSDRKLG
jgi:hypothetical protein